MNKTNTVTILLLIVAIFLGVVNLKMFSAIQPQNTQVQNVPQQQVATANATEAATIHNATGTLVSISGNNLSMNIGNEQVPLVLGSDAKFYQREIMSDAKYDAALKAAQTPAAPKQIEGDSAGGVFQIAKIPVKDVYNELNSIDQLNLKSGDNVTVAFAGDLSSSKTILEIVKVVEIK